MPDPVRQVGRPRREPDDRVAMSIRLRPDTHARLLVATTERDVSMNWLVQRAVDDFLDRLIPADEIVLTRAPGGSA